MILLKHGQIKVNSIDCEVNFNVSFGSKRFLYKLELCFSDGISWRLNFLSKKAEQKLLDMDYNKKTVLTVKEMYAGVMHTILK